MFRKTLQLTAVVSVLVTASTPASEGPSAGSEPSGNCLTASGEIITTSEDKLDEACVEVTISLSYSPSFPRRSDIVTFSFFASHWTECGDSFGNYWPWTSGTSFQRGIDDQPNPFTWEVWCIGAGVERASVVIHIDEGGPPPPPSGNQASFVSQSVPATMTAGTSVAVSVTMANTGSTSWTAGSGYKLGSQNPPDNTTWGLGRVLLPGSATIQPGQSHTFTFTATAPVTPGTYNFQWRMLREQVEWFGDSTPNVAVAVVAAAPSCTGAVVLYEFPNYGGRCWSFGAGEHGSLGDADNVASSMRVASGYAATLFADPSFGGGLYTTLSSSTDAGGWTDVGDNAASALIVQIPEQLVRFTPESAEGSAEESTQPVGPTAAGCWRVWDGFSSYSQYDRRAFTYKLSVGAFCVKGNKITRVDARSIVVDIPPFPFPLNLVNQWRYSQSFFLPGEAGGRTTTLKVQGVFDFCLFRYGCTLSYNKWIQIELSGDGTAICTNSEDQRRRPCARQSV